MAINSTIFKVDVDLSNLDAHIYKNYNLTMAMHPSEKESRMMYRLLSFLYCANENLSFTKGLSAQDEPELWEKNFSGDITLWIELGLPDLKRIRQACGKSNHVKIFTYHKHKSVEWWSKIKGSLLGNNKLSIYHLDLLGDIPLDSIVTKSMKLSCVIEEGVMFLSNDAQRIGVKVTQYL